jgi:hypothetical protein
MALVIDTISDSRLRGSASVIAEVTPDEFSKYQKVAYTKGFLRASASPFTRSTHAGDDFVRLRAQAVDLNSEEERPLRRRPASLAESPVHRRNGATLGLGQNKSNTVMYRY